MIITGINGSPRGSKGHTGHMLGEIQKGVRSTDSEMNIINLSESRIKMCVGCFRCWNMHEGICCIKDDLNGILSVINTSDIVILGTPLYYDNVSALLKIFLERLLPVHTGKLVIGSDGYYKHDLNRSTPDIVMLASCDLPELEHFSVIREYARKISKNLNSSLIAEIYKSQARTFDLGFTFITQKLKEFDLNLYNAGVELATQHTISQTTLDKISEPVVTTEMYVKSANSFHNKGKQIYF